MIKTARSSRSGPLERFTSRHYRLSSLIFAGSVAFFPVDTFWYLWRDRATVSSGWAAAVAVGLAVPLIVAAIGGVSFRRRSGLGSLAALMTMGVLTIAALFAAGSKLPPDHTTTSAFRAGALAVTAAVEAVLVLAAAWRAAKPPYRTVPRWVRSLLRKV